MLSTAGLLLGLLATSSTAAAGVKEQILYSFCSNGSTCLDGENPHSPLILDSAGNLYGTVYGGGDYDRGAVFELTPVANRQWTETLLYSFCPSGICEDGRA
jgi:uncharacterized repeat protein (TIGR03803 family)